MMRTKVAAVVLFVANLALVLCLRALAAVVATWAVEESLGHPVRFFPIFACLVVVPIVLGLGQRSRA